jgi:hypothetical protein
MNSRAKTVRGACGNWKWETIRTWPVGLRHVMTLVSIPRVLWNSKLKKMDGVSQKLTLVLYAVRCEIGVFYSDVHTCNWISQQCYPAVCAATPIIQSPHEISFLWNAVDLSSDSRSRDCWDIKPTVNMKSLICLPQNLWRHRLWSFMSFSVCPPFYVKGHMGEN